MMPAALMRDAQLRLAAAVQPPIAADLLANLPTDEERAWCARMRAAMTQPPGNERSRG
jgi:hypothetical protein